MISSGQVYELRDLVFSLAASEKKFGESHFYEFDKSGNTQRVWNLFNKHVKFREFLETSIVDNFMDYIFDNDIACLRTIYDR